MEEAAVDNLIQRKMEDLNWKSSNWSKKSAKNFIKWTQLKGMEHCFFLPLG
jgi:hypothetical protein